MTCRGFQFEEGKTYEEKKAELCKSGFHACEIPLDVFTYYSPNNSVYHEVELNDVNEEKSDDSKVCAKKIRIGAELSIHNLVKAHVEYVKEHIDKSVLASTNTGNRSASTNTGDYGSSEVSGNKSIAIAFGRNSKARGVIGCWIVIAEHDNDGPKDVRCFHVDGKNVKADTWYCLKDGALTEVVDE